VTEAFCCTIAKSPSFFASPGTLCRFVIVFKLSPIGGGQWIETVVHPFQGPPDGAFAYNGMVVDRFGNFYGATVRGGKNDDGCVYKFTP
jgi:hypothetical protein